MSKMPPYQDTLRATQAGPRARPAVPRARGRALLACLALACCGSWRESPDAWKVEKCWVRQPYALEKSQGKFGPFDVTSIRLIRARKPLSPFPGGIGELGTVIDDVRRVAVTERYLVVELGEDAGPYAVIDLAADSALPTRLPTKADLEAFAEGHPSLAAPLRFRSFEEVQREAFRWWHQPYVFLTAYLVAWGGAILGALLARWRMARAHAAALRREAEAAREPWESPGAVRRDCEPHHGGPLAALGWLSLALGAVSVCCSPCGLAGIPVSLSAWVLARRDLAAMRAGVMDRVGRTVVERARRNGVCGLILGLPSLAQWAVLALDQLT